MRNTHPIFRALPALVVSFLAVSGLLLAEEKKVNLKVGNQAPKFESTDDQGKAWKSTDHVGKKIMVVYFYPADLTGGCTKQACGFRDDLKSFSDKDVEVIGVSGDSVSVVMVGYSCTPSCRDKVFLSGVFPKICSLLRSTPVVSSPPSFVQLSPRSVDLKR